MRRPRLARVVLAVASVGQLSCGQSSPSPSPSAPTFGPSEVPVAGVVRDALNVETVSFGYIEMSQPGNRTGEVLYRGSNGCASCFWGDGRYGFLVTAGRPFKLSVFVIGFEEQVRELTLTGSGEVDFALVPRPVTIRILIRSNNLNMPLQCFPARVEFIDGPNAGREASLNSGTVLVVDDLQPTDSTVRVSAPGYLTQERSLLIRPGPRYPDAAGEWTFNLACANCTSPEQVTCGP